MPVSSLRSIETGVHWPIGSGFTFEISVVVHGAVLPIGVVIVRVVAQPMGVNVLVPATTGKVLVEVKDTFRMRDAAGNDFAGYVAVTVATAPADAAHPHAAHALAPE